MTYNQKDQDFFSQNFYPQSNAPPQPMYDQSQYGGAPPDPMYNQQTNQGYSHPSNPPYPQQNDQGYYGGQQEYSQQPQAFNNEFGNYSQTNYGETQFLPDQQFQQFNYGEQAAPPVTGVNNDSNFSTPAPGYSAEPDVNQFAPGGPAPQSPYTGSIMTPSQLPGNKFSDNRNDDDEEEPPLMEELGINIDHICQKTLAVLNPLREPSPVIMQDTDLAGPLVFCLAFGATLLLAGKVHFGFIYGSGVVGCLCMYGLLNLMSMNGVSASITISVLGYCLLPMVLLSTIAAFFSLQGVVGTVATALTVLWCCGSASKLFITALAMEKQQLLVAYPCALVYGVFALITVF